MINILPEQQKSVLKKEYEYRRAVVFFGLVTFALVVSLILLFPSYFLTNMRAQEVSAQLEKVRTDLNSQLPPGEIVDGLISAARHAQDLKPFSQSLSIYDLIKILESRPDSIKINQITFSDKAEVGPEISVSGLARDRESLIGFGRVLEERVEFESVDIPVSNFVKETNIEFSLRIDVK